jgi:putative membrane protein
MRMLVVMTAATLVVGTAAFAQPKAPAESVAFAKKVASANTFEIQSSELARDHSQSSDVKSFAEQMIKDHTKAGNDFKAAVAEAQISPPPPEEPNAKQGATLTKLKNAQGAAFDKAYVSAQLAAHKEAVALFRKYSKRGRTGPLKQFAQSTLPTLEHHLAMVQELSRPSGVASRPAPGPQGSGAKGSGGAAIGPPAQTPQRANKP